MLTFEIGDYRITALMGPDQPVRLYMYDDTGTYRGYISFFESGSFQPYTLHPNGIINAGMPLSKLEFVVEMLRVESPVSFRIHEKYGWALIQTGLEPVGEEEGAAG